MSAPLAHFLTWTCYGQRLHGDARGSVDRDNNTRGTPVLPGDPAREHLARAAMNDAPVTLTKPMITLVESAIAELCRENGWNLLAISIRPTHAHVVLNIGGRATPERVLMRLKARATRELRRAGLVNDEARTWTRHGSTRWLNHEAGLSGAIAYVNDWQTGPNREMLEAHRELVRARVEDLRAWLRLQGLPEDGRGVVMGEGGAKAVARITKDE